MIGTQVVVARAMSGGETPSLACRPAWRWVQRVRLQTQVAVEGYQVITVYGSTTRFIFSRIYLLGHAVKLPVTVAQCELPAIFTVSYCYCSSGHRAFMPFLF